MTGVQTCALPICLLAEREEELKDEVSLEKHVTPDTPPTFLWHTWTDELVPVENSLMFAAALRRAGVNRLSLGVQSTDDALLQAIGRVHTFAQVQEAVAAARRAKIKNLSLDLIYGLPGQTMAQWEKTLQDAVDLQPEHLSCYGLKLEPEIGRASCRERV